VPPHGTEPQPGASAAASPPPWPLTQASERPRMATAAKRGAGRLHPRPAAARVMATRRAGTGGGTGKLPLRGGWTGAEGLGGPAALSWAEATTSPQACPWLPHAGCPTEIPLGRRPQQCPGPWRPAAGSAPGVRCPENLPGGSASRACRTSSSLFTAMQETPPSVNRISNTRVGFLNGPIGSWDWSENSKPQRLLVSRCIFCSSYCLLNPHTTYK